MSYSTAQIWLVIAATGLGTFVIRYSFLGLVGNRTLPPFVLRLLRYTPVAVLPALTAPLVLWPAATGGETDPPRLLAAAATLLVGLALRSAIWSIAAGVVALYSAQALGL